MCISAFRARRQSRSSRFSSAMTSPDVTIREATARDAEAICGIYNPHVRDTIVTFEEIEVPPSEMSERIAAVSAMFPWLVAAEAGLVVGYAYAAKHRDRSAYRHAVETTIYIAEHANG